MPIFEGSDLQKRQLVLGPLQMLRTRRQVLVQLRLWRVCAVEVQGAACSDLPTVSFGFRVVSLSRAPSLVRGHRGAAHHPVPTLFLRFPCWASVRADLLGNSRYFRDSSWVRRFSRPAFPCGPSFLRCAAEVSRVTGLSLVPAFTVCLVLYILLCLFPLPVIITAMFVFRTGGFS